jgi:hypothetical protein
MDQELEVNPHEPGSPSTLDNHHNYNLDRL